jgi:proline iminopeptidase
MCQIKIMKISFRLTTILLFFVATLDMTAQADSLFVTASDGVKLFVKVSGTGNPVLFIHGGPGSNSLYFEKEGGAIFEKTSRMIYLDQRGCGRSDAPPDQNYSLARVVQDFDEVRKALGIEKWTVMAHSFGGILATEYATQHPENIKSMVYLNGTVSLPDSALSGIGKTIEILPQLTAEEVAYLKNDRISVIERFFTAFGQLNKYGKKYMLQYEREENAKKDDALMARPDLKWDMGKYVLSIPEYLVSFAPKTAKINLPVLVISGKKDFAIGPDHPEIMKFPHMKVVYINGGHALYTEHQQELYKKVKPFLLR